MANEFEQRGTDQSGSDKSKASEMYSQVKEKAGEAAHDVSENIGTISTTAILFGFVGFAVGFMCGQNSMRSWHSRH